MTDQRYPIPWKLNVLLVGGVFLVQTSFIAIASHVNLLWTVVIAFAFSFLFQTNYSLLHEGGHRLLHPHSKVNWLLSLITGLTFPGAPSMLRVTHHAHHCCNRTEHEMFDCYREGDNRLIKWLQWYSILLGPFWITVPIGSVVTAISPRLVKTKPFQEARSASRLFEGFDQTTVWFVRLEVCLCVIYFMALVWIAQIQLVPTLILYTFAAFNWSSRQYVSHVGSSRDVMEGAWNLNLSKPMQWILLNYNWHHQHHSNPSIPWIYLPKLASPSDPSTSYLKQYLIQWRPPHQLDEACPPPREAYTTVGRECRESTTSDRRDFAGAAVSSK